MISADDRLRIDATVQAEFGNVDLADALCALADIVGLEKALLELNRILADPRLRSDRPAS